MNDDWGTWLAAVLLLDVAIGGAAAGSVGRALARSWKPFALVPLAMILLSAGIGFLHYAIFGLSPIPIYDIGQALFALVSSPREALLRLAGDAIGWIAIAILLTVFAALGFLFTRRRQMIERYDWLFEPAGFWSWREKPRRTEPNG